MATKNVTLKAATKTNQATKAPTGLSITRNGWTYTAKWSCADTDYDAGQQFQYCVNGGGWVAISIKENAREVSFSLVERSYKPYTGTALVSVQFRVQGKRSTHTETVKTSKKKKKTTYKYTQKVTYKHAYSAWANQTFAFVNPPQPAAPSYTASSDTQNSGTFEWSVETSDSSTAPFTQIRWQSLLQANFNTSADKANWSNATTTATSGSSGSYTFSEDSSVLVANGSSARLVRVQSRGPHGDTGWSYGYHVYATPYTPSITYASLVKDSNGVRTLRANWNQPADIAHPVDTMTACYYIGTPGSGLACPSGASWTDGQTLVRTDTTCSTQFSLDAEIGEDEVLFVRVATKYDSNITYSLAEIPTGGFGMLAAPTLTSASASGTSLTVSVVNNSSVPDSRIAVKLITSSNQAGRWLGTYIAHDSTDAIFTIDDVDDEDWYKVQIQAFQGSSIQDPNMVSASVTSEETAVAVAPKSVTASITDTAGTVRLEWDWPWSSATRATISWADHADAWESTDEPSTYEISRKATAWNVGGLDDGSTWYFRVKLSMGSDDALVESAWSDMASVDLATAPATPSLAVQNAWITIDDPVTMTCGFTGASDATVVIAESTDDGIVTADGQEVILVTAPVSSVISITVDEINTVYRELGLTEWAEGEVHFLAARVTSTAGAVSPEWSNPASVRIVTPPEITSVVTSLETVTDTVTDEEGNESIREASVLTSMPLTVTVTGAGAGGTTAVSIARAEAYTIRRPDRKKEDCFEGEAIAAVTQTGEDEITFTLDSLTGHLDDNALYRIEVVITDEYGQMAETEIPFEVRWSHQPEVPFATVVSDTDGLATQITVDAPEGYVEGDYCEIYRLSADLPELIVPNAVYETTYVDPYPAFNEFTGHRIVNRTANGDYITADGVLAWLDTGAESDDSIGSDEVVIDFDGQRMELPYNIELSNSWGKDFKRTTYLGGSVRGDWNPAVTRDLSVKTSLVVDTDNTDEIIRMRELANFAGICHVRTPDGSSFAADVQVSEDRGYDTGPKVSFSLSISAVDPEEFEGMTLAEWEEMQSEEEGT